MAAQVHDAQTLDDLERRAAELDEIIEQMRGEQHRRGDGEDALDFRCRMDRWNEEWHERFNERRWIAKHIADLTPLEPDEVRSQARQVVEHRANELERLADVHHSGGKAAVSLHREATALRQIAAILADDGTSPYRFSRRDVEGAQRDAKAIDPRVFESGDNVERALAVLILDPEIRGAIDRKALEQARRALRMDEEGLPRPTKTAPELRPGDVLPNHRTLVAIRKIRSARRGEAGDLYAVLALNEPGFATWILVDAPEEEGGPRTIHGYYPDSFEKAVADFNERTL